MCLSLRDGLMCVSRGGGGGVCILYVPASYIMYLSDFCRFLLCTCRWERMGERGSWEGGIERG